MLTAATYKQGLYARTNKGRTIRCTNKGCTCYLSYFKRLESTLCPECTPKIMKGCSYPSLSLDNLVNGVTETTSCLIICNCRRISDLLVKTSLELKVASWEYRSSIVCALSNRTTLGKIIYYSFTSCTGHWQKLLCFFFWHYWHYVVTLCSSLEAASTQ